MSEPMDIDFPLWAALSIVGASVVLMLMCVACCSVRCFRPENSKGSAWFPSRNGRETFVRGAFQESDGKSGFVRVLDAGSRPAAALPVVNAGPAAAAVETSASLYR